MRNKYIFQLPLGDWRTLTAKKMTMNMRGSIRSADGSVLHPSPGNQWLQSRDKCHTAGSRFFVYGPPPTILILQVIRKESQIFLAIDVKHLHDYIDVGPALLVLRHLQCVRTPAQETGLWSDLTMRIWFMLIYAGYSHFLGVLFTSRWYFTTPVGTFSSPVAASLRRRRHISPL